MYIFCGWLFWIPCLFLGAIYNVQQWLQLCSYTPPPDQREREKQPASVCVQWMYTCIPVLVQELWIRNWIIPHNSAFVILHSIPYNSYQAQK